ncbi:MAG TPA: hypothetical protein VK981_00300 [Ramlibacter sp.]|nr:hypothetical protein [Ramlibacter sp.]
MKPQAPQPAGHGMAMLVVGATVLLVIAGWWWAVVPGPPPSESRGTPQTATDKPAQLPCAKVLGCAAGLAIEDAGKQCRPQIEELAAFAPRWTNRANESIFVDHMWLQQDKGTLTFMGKHAQFQDAGGRFAPVAYECDYDPATRQVLAVRAKAAAG